MMDAYLFDVKNVVAVFLLFVLRLSLIEVGSGECICGDGCGK